MSKAVFREHFEQIWNNKDAGGIERFIAPNYRGFDAEEVISGIEGYKQHFVTITTGFPDMRLTIKAMEEEDRAVARWVFEATNTGNFGDIPPTGRRVRMTGISIALIPSRQRQLVEEHSNADVFGLMRQLGPSIPASVKVPPLFF
jgi:predicted ester cyclase